MEPAKKMENQADRTAGDQQSPEEEVSVERRSARRRRGRQSEPEISVNMGELRELIQLIRENDFTEFELERESFRVRFRRGPEYITAEPAPRGFSTPEHESLQPTTATGEAKSSAAQVPSHPGAKAQTEAAEDQDLHIIPSPIVGTFYRSPSPNAESFVKIGSNVEPDTVVCIIEAMKLMNEIQAETSGEVTKIYVENGQPVEYGQPLFGIKK
jgi:acetyl-CoA carboxylase biotin carboxyl carrier protein